MKKKTMKIAILGWGSLLWEGGEEFDCWHNSWMPDGPSIKLEFSRVSASRAGALTLVIDPKNGADVSVAYCLSKRRNPDDAVCDLRCREGTTLSNIGYLFFRESRNHYRDEESFKAIKAWAEAKKIDVVIWTDLPSNFEKKIRKPFTINSALSYIQRELTSEGKAKAAEYIWRAPAFVQTPLRNALEQNPWFETSTDNNSMFSDGLQQISGES